MEDPRDPRDGTRAGDLIVVLAAKAAIGVAVLRGGFFALSDDDFSRVVIAERFAVAPSFDPSGTSWLPLPFWITGSAMAAFGRTFSVARGVAVLLGLISALFVHRAARYLGASRPAAMLGAIVATTIPTAGRLGVSFQPEAFTAGLIVFGVATSGSDGAPRTWGAVAITLACLCRYEAWPVAGVFAVCCALRGRQTADGERRALVLPALLAGAGPLFWLVHGAVTHGDALFFLHRVAAYRRALGVTEGGLTSLAAYPALLVGAEPELTLGGIALVAGATFHERPLLISWKRPALFLAALFCFLVVGRFLDGAPTHHGERTLLPIWAGLTLFSAEAVVRLVRHRRLTALLASAVFAALGYSAVRFARTSETFPRRNAERAIGLAARTALPANARLFVDTGDFGYFAVIAAFGAPERAEAVDRHDPRDAKNSDVFATAAALEAWLKARPATFMVVRREHWLTARSAGRLVATRSDFALVNFSPHE